MARQAKEEILLAWTALVPVSEGQDPLGLNLRVSARLASQLFHCITSITPRARSYSFLPWAVSLAGKMSPTKPLRERLRFIEKAFGASCILHHEGSPCEGGRLIGSDSLAKWYAAGAGKRIDIDGLPFAKNPALSAYLASLVNLRLFDTEEQAEEPDAEDQAQEVVSTDLDLSALGEKVAKAYERSVAKPNPKTLLAGPGKPSRDDLSKWGKAGGLCELTEHSADLRILRDLMFNRVDLPGRGHLMRRDSLLLILHLMESAADHGVALDASSFGDAVYFRSMWDSDAEAQGITWPKGLDDIAARWRMFYFHFYLSAVLENLFVCVVNEANLKRMEGFQLGELLAPLTTSAFNKGMRKLLGVAYEGNFSELTPHDLFAASRVDIAHFNPMGSRELDETVPIDHPLSESMLHYLLDQRDRYATPEALALSAVLCAVLCFRYLHLEKTPHGNWFAKTVKDDPYENVTVPVVVRELRQRFDDVWRVPFGEPLRFLLNRYVIRLHLSLAYQRSGSFFYVDGERIRGRGKRYDEPGYGNGRFPSALRILEDLRLVATDPDDGLTRRTPDGDKVLKAELAKDGAQ